MASVATLSAGIAVARWTSRWRVLGHCWGSPPGLILGGRAVPCGDHRDVGAFGGAAAFAGLNPAGGQARLRANRHPLRRAISCWLINEPPCPRVLIGSLAACGPAQRQCSPNSNRQPTPSGSPKICAAGPVSRPVSPPKTTALIGSPRGGGDDRAPCSGRLWGLWVYVGHSPAGARRAPGS